MPAPAINTRIVAAPRGQAVRRITWTARADAHLVKMRNEGASFRTMAAAFSLSRHTVAERATHLGLHVRVKAAAKPAKPRRKATDPLVDLSRDALPAGHPISWDTINMGTSLEGAPYTPPSNDRLGRAQGGLR